MGYDDLDELQPAPQGTIQKFFERRAQILVQFLRKTKIWRCSCKIINLAPEGFSSTFLIDI